MKRIGRCCAMVLLISLTAGEVHAQTEESLRRAIGLYENLQIEQARAALLRVISPNSPFEVTREQRVTAYLYLGAALASLNEPDSAVVYFQAAIERDAFADLDPQRFTEEERRWFAEAKRRSFRVGARPVVGDTIDPRSESVVFQTVTTHDGVMRVEVSGQGLRFPLFEGDNDGLREVPWSGTLPQGGLVPSGTYQLIVTGLSTALRRMDSTTVLFNVEHQIEPLEDTIRAFREGELMPEQLPRSVARSDLLVGLGVAASALLIPPIIGDKDLGTPAALSLSVAGIGAAAGLFAFLHRTHNPDIPENIAENQRRRLERQQENEAILQRNTTRVANTRLIITPATGVGR